MKIVLSPLASQKMRAYIKIANGEISGLGQSVLLADEVIEVRDIWIWKQTCTDATTEVIDHNSVFDLAGELVAKGIPMEELNVWWHSHANMSPFFSGVDAQTAEEWQNDKYLVSIVGNKRDDFYGRIDLKKPFNVHIDDVLVESNLETADDNLMTELRAEIAEKVTQRVFKTWTSQIGKTYQDNTRYDDIDSPLWCSEKQTYWEEIASECACDECVKYLSGKSTFFNHSAHQYSLDKHTYIPIK